MYIYIHPILRQWILTLTEAKQFRVGELVEVGVADRCGTHVYIYVCALGWDNKFSHVPRQGVSGWANWMIRVEDQCEGENGPTCR